MRVLRQYWVPLAFATLAAVAYIAGRCHSPDPVPSVLGKRDTVWVKAPTPDPTVIERIRYREVPVERVVVRERVDTLRVQEFVEAAQHPDSLPPVQLGKAFEYDGEKLLLWGVMSTGDEVLTEVDIRPKFQGGWAGDSVWTRESRLARFPTLKVAGGAIVVGGVIILCALRC